MQVKNETRDFSVPTNVMVEAELDQAMRTLYFHGVSVEAYKKFYADQYQRDAMAEGMERDRY